MRGPVACKLAHQRRRDDVAREHAHGAEEEELAPPDGVHGPDGGGDADELQDVEDSGHDQLHIVVETHFPGIWLMCICYQGPLVRVGAYLNRVGE